MFVSYFDDSYTEGTSVVALAGFFAPGENWTAYEQAAAEIYGQYNVRCLHTKDLHSTRGEFKRWNRQKKISFIEEAFDAAKMCAVEGLSVCISKSTAKIFNSASKYTAQSSALGIAFGNAMDQICNNVGLLSISRGRDTVVIVEKGNKNNREIRKIFNSWKGKEVANHVKSLSFVNKGESLAVHLADFCAFYSRRLASRAMQFDLNRSDDIVKEMDDLMKVAVSYVPVTVSIGYGGVTQDIENRNLFSIQSMKRFQFGPIRT